jgi:hypothetical protein
LTFRHCIWFPETKALAQESGRTAGDSLIGLYVLDDDRSRPDDRTIADCHIGNDSGTRPYDDIFAADNASRKMGAGADMASVTEKAIMVNTT